MATTFPTTLQDLDATRGTATQRLNSPSHSTHHALEDDTIEALQAKVGINSSAVTSSLDYILRNAASANPGHTHTAAQGASDKTFPSSAIVGISDTQTLTSKTLTSPIIGTSILDTGSNELFKLTATASAVNEFTIANAATGNSPVFSATGDNTDIGIDITPKGAGKLRLTANDFNLGAAAANIQVNGADPKRAFYIPASAMTAATTNGAATGTYETANNKVIIPVYDFDTTTQEFVGLALPSPHWWDASTVTVQFIWTCATGNAADTVVWACQGIAFSDDDALDTAYGTEQTASDVVIAALDDHHSPFTSAITIAGTPVAGDLVCLRFKRVPASDNLAADARLIGVKVRFGMAQYDDQ